MDQRLKNAFSLNQKITVYIPATKNIIENGTKKSIEIDNKKYVEMMAEMLSKIHGGATALNQTTGYWFSDDRNCLDVEHTTPIYSFCENAENGITDILDFCEWLKSELNQDAIAIEINGVMYFI